MLHVFFGMLTASMALLMLHSAMAGEVFWTIVYCFNLFALVAFVELC
jgi:hypothetical protein